MQWLAELGVGADPPAAASAVVAVGAEQPAPGEAFSVVEKAIEAGLAPMKKARRRAKLAPCLEWEAEPGHRDQLEAQLADLVQVAYQLREASLPRKELKAKKKVVRSLLAEFQVHARGRDELAAMLAELELALE